MTNTSFFCTLEQDFKLLESSPTQGHAQTINYADPAPIAAQPPPPAAAVSNPSKAAESHNALKFNLLTHDQFGGYMISINPNQVQLLHRIVTQTGLYQHDGPTVSRLVLYDSKSRRHPTMTKKAFQAAMKRVFDHTTSNLAAPLSSSIQHELTAFTDKLFTMFANPKTNKVNGVALACGFTVLCNGRKSDKLEHIFELLDEDKDTWVSQDEIAKFIQSFLIMLMSVSSSFTHLYGGACSNDSAAITQTIDAGSDWATSQVFDALKPKNGSICFDDFADWYTKGGYQSMPWLELLDLRKWVISA